MNQWNFCQIWMSSLPCTNVKPPYWRFSGDGSGLNTNHLRNFRSDTLSKDKSWKEIIIYEQDKENSNNILKKWLEYKIHYYSLKISANVKMTCNVFAPNAPPLVARLFQWQYLTFPSSYSLQFPLNNYEKRRSKRSTCCERALFQSNCSSTRTRCIFVAHTVLVFHALLHLWNLPWKKKLFAFLNSRVLRETFCWICSSLSRIFYASYFEGCVL